MDSQYDIYVTECGDERLNNGYPHRQFGSHLAKMIQVRGAPNGGFLNRMRTARFLALGATVLTTASVAIAQFTGPAPLAWRWSASTSVSPSGKPVVSGDTVYVAVGNRIYALDRQSGNQKWKFPNVDPIPGAFRQGVLHAENLVVAAADNRVIYAVDAKTGQSKWQYISPIPFQGAPVMAGKFVVFGLNDNSIMAVNSEDGQAAWPAPYKIFAGLEGGIASNGTTIYYMTGANELVSHSVSANKPGWKARFSMVSPDSAPVIYGDNLYVVSGQWLACLSASTGSQRWQQNVGEPLVFSPAVSPDGVLVVSRDGNARLFEPGSGRPKLRTAVPLGGVPVTSPSAVDKMFVAPTSNGSLNLINPSTGTVVWNYLLRPIGGPLIRQGSGNNRNETRIYTIPAAGPAVLAGSSLMVLASDGSLFTFDSNQGVDKTGPSIKMLWPNSGDQVSGMPPLELIFRIEDEASGINDKTLSIKVNGQDASFEFGRDGFAVVRISSVGKNRPLRDGRATILVSATDWMGNISNAEFGLLIDNTLKPLARPANTGPTGGSGGNIGGG